MSETPLKREAGYLIKLGSKTTAARVSAVHHTVDMTDYKPAAARTVAVNDLASVTVAFDGLLPLTAYRDCRELGGFILIDRLTNETVALGLIDRPLADDPPAANRVSAVAALASRLHGWLSQAREKPLRSIAKAVTWRTTGSVDTFILSFLFTGDAKISAAISGSEIFTKLALYYVHERLWARSRFGLRKS
jgi:bifunctional enzyme CysN/CysC/sulfate adenylyltransferase subunit 1